MRKQFIKATEEKCSFEKHIPAPYIRKSFNLDFVPSNAEISICGLGFYRLYINGEEITKGPLAPYISNPDDLCYYDTYNLTDKLTCGENVIGVILGNGFYNNFCGGIWDFNLADWVGAPRLALEFSAENNGSKLFFEADESFKIHSSAITFDDYRMGVYYDANAEIADWNKPGFDDSAWKNALPAENPRGEFKLCEAEPITVTKELKPIKITPEDDGFLYDFGENNAGVCRLSIDAKAGQKIEFQHGEILRDGKFSVREIGFGDRPDYEWYDEYNQKDIYITKDGKQTYVPGFTYHGFRYVLVKGITAEQATEDLLTYLVMSSDIKTIGEFECSDKTLNTLFEMAQRSDRANFYYFPTDCPHREKNGWTGDASMSADHMVLMHDVEKSWEEWLVSIRKAQADCGKLPGIVPTGGWGFAWGNGPIWDSVLFNLPYMLYKFRNNTKVIIDNAHAMMRYLEYVMTRRDENGTIAIGLGDWCPVDRNSDAYVVPLAFTDSLTVMDIAGKAAEMFDAVGLKHQAEFAESIFKDMRATIRRELVDLETCLVKGDCQSGQALALYYGIFDTDDEKQKAFDILLKFIHDKNDSFDCGFFGLHTIFHVLSDFGYGELAYKMIAKKDFPSYGYFIETGETTLPEMFMSNGYCGSHNHHFMGDIARWFMCRVAGLNVKNHNTVEIAPDLFDTLDYAKASCELPCGKISVSWNRDGKNIMLNVDCDEKINYFVVLPKGYEMKNGVITKK